MTRRSSIVLLVLLAGFVVGVGGLAAWVLRGTGRATEAHVSAAEDAGSAGSVADAVGLATPVSDPLTDSAPREPEAVTPAPRPAQRLGAEDSELADAHWVEGRVLFPPDTPFGEAVEILARGKSFEHRDLHRATVGDDGSFRVAFAPKTRTGWLVMEADHIYIDKPLRVKPREEPSDIELRAKLGGRIAGVVVAPPLADDDRADLVGAEVELEGSEYDVMTDVGHKRDAELDDLLAFAFGGLPPGLDYEIELDSDVLATARLDGLTITPGETTEVQLEATLGVRVSGVVLDADGAPVAEAELLTFTHVDTKERRGAGRPDEFELAEDGSFLARGVAPGQIALVAKAEGYVSRRLDLGERADGDREEGVRLVLDRGHFVRGHVQWPEGDRVSECTVQLTQDRDQGDVPFKVRSGDVIQGELEVETGADGTFELTGLGPGPYALAASAVRPDERGRRRKKGPRWNAQMEELAANTDGLVVTLVEGFAASGRVVDDQGAPLDRFVIQAMPEDERRSLMIGGDWWFDSDEGLSRKFYDAGGVFTLEGFRPGRWSVRALAEGHESGEPISIELPGEGGALELMLLRAALIRGVVLDPVGNPVEGARVSVQTKGGPAWLKFMDNHGARTDAAGLFEVDDAPSGRVTVTAKAGGFAPSADFDLELRPGVVEAGVALSLRKGGRITGQLLSTRGEPVAGRKIDIDLGEWSFLDRATRTDESGAFSYDSLPPGTYALSAALSDEERRALEADGELGKAEEWSIKKQATVEIVGEETVHVVLGAPPENAVIVTGRITRAGEPVAGAELWVNPVASERGHQSRGASSRADGSYEVVLEEPGEYSFSIAGEKGARLSRIETIPDADSHRVDIELPSGGIAGVVIGPGGEPATEVPVMLSAATATAETRSFGISGWQQTGEDGSFRFEGVASGDYVLSAGHSMWDGSGEAEYGTAVVEVTVDGDEVVEGVELQVEEAATLAGTVRDHEGRPASGATIFVRNEGGALLSTWSMVVTDGAGRFRRTGLNSGTWTVSARRGTSASAESRPVRVPAGGEAEVDLELQLSTMLIVHAEDSGGTPVGASLSVTDEAGREYRAMHALLDQGLDAEYQEGLARVVGPLPPGAYRVIVSNHDGVSAEREIELDGEERREVRLRLEGEEQEEP